MNPEISPPKSPLIKEMIQRGYIHQCTDLAKLDKKLENEKITAYIGFDCTAPSLHVGSLLQLMLLRLIQAHGNKVIVILGSATTRIGDPSDKDETRPILDLETIEKNKIGITGIVNKFLNTAQNPALILDNIDWLGDIKYLDFLGKYGRHFSMHRMLGFDKVKQRLKQQNPFSFLEFNYSLLQAYDFLHLSMKYGCLLQLGGSEQWANIIMGVELSQKINNEELFGLTTPLITTANGSKMGKTNSGAVWLDINMTSSYDFWQFWRNTDDKDIIKFLRLYTSLPEEEILMLDNLQDEQRNKVKIKLADTVTTICHGEEDAKNAAILAHQVFVDRAKGEKIYEINIRELYGDVALINILKATGLSQSGSAARNLIMGGGVYINDKKYERFDLPLSELVNDSSEQFRLSIGKKKHILIKITK